MTDNFPERFDALDRPHENAAVPPVVVVGVRLLLLFFSCINRKNYYDGEYRSDARPTTTMSAYGAGAGIRLTPGWANALNSLRPTRHSQGRN
jgi:hypothetical protein